MLAVLFHINLENHNLFGTVIFHVIPICLNVHVIIIAWGWMCGRLYMGMGCVKNVLGRNISIYIRKVVGQGFLTGSLDFNSICNNQNSNELGLNLDLVELLVML
jgi:hypothetical protein